VTNFTSRRDDDERSERPLGPIRAVDFDGAGLRDVVVAFMGS